MATLDQVLGVSSGLPSADENKAPKKSKFIGGMFKKMVKGIRSSNIPTDDFKYVQWICEDVVHPTFTNPATALIFPHHDYTSMICAGHTY